MQPYIKLTKWYGRLIIIAKELTENKQRSSQAIAQIIIVVFVHK